MADFDKRTHRLSLADLRENYGLARLTEQNCQASPIVQFENWIKDAERAGLQLPNAMVLSTATTCGQPSARVVLLKDVSDLGFVFYTNYTSRKALELESNPFASLTFYWPELERQVRVEGRVQRTARQLSEAYFRSRPKGSRLGAWASRQSQPLPGREPLDARLKELERIYADTDDIPVPEFWGGYCLMPGVIEFWQGRPNRLHDRLQYRRNSEQNWIVERLSP
ncbi:MAG: pyridoxamine 5'-phosphate oxidase [Acidobacteriaceae bacterium]|nr:pyridoxamine 5'-phosphate oxidase [Acidobacteriaceae bacterium]MBV9780173.1 pyridoxamine 5'-phosphate oxidase [Acidobacteriaceae bacterium]